MSDTDNKPVEYQPGIMVPGGFIGKKLEPVVPPTPTPVHSPFQSGHGDDHYALDITRVSCLAGNQPTTSFPLSSRLKADLIGLARG